MASTNSFENRQRHLASVNDGSVPIYLSQQERLARMGGYENAPRALVEKAASAEIGVFLRLPQSVSMDPSLGLDTKIVWSFIRTRAFDRENPHMSRFSIPTISVSTGIPEHRVKEAIKEIKMRRLADVRQVKREAGRHNEYRSFDPKDFYGDSEHAFEDWKTIGRIGGLIQEWTDCWKRYEKAMEERFSNSKSVFFRSTEKRLTFRREEVTPFNENANPQELEDLEEKNNRITKENSQKEQDGVFYSKNTFSVKRDSKLKSVLEFFGKKTRHASYLYLLKKELYKPDAVAIFDDHLPSIEPIIIGLAFKELFTYAKETSPFSHEGVFELIEVWAALGKCFDTPIEAIFFLNWTISNWTSVSPLFVENCTIETGRDEIAILIELIGKENNFSKSTCESFVTKARAIATGIAKT